MSYLQFPDQNIHNPERYPNEDFEIYQARRKVSQAEARAAVQPARSDVFVHRASAPGFVSEKQREERKRRAAQQQRRVDAQRPAASAERSRKPHKPTEPFVSLIGKPKRQWCPERKSGS